MLGLTPEIVVPEKWRRLWRRRLRRRPLLPVLAFALVVVNAVLVFLVQFRLAGNPFWSIVLGCGVAELGLASAWITTSRRLIWLRLMTVLFLLTMIVTAALPWRIFAPGDRLNNWASSVAICLLVVGVTTTLLWPVTVVARKIRRVVRSIAATWTCPHCGKNYVVADETPLRISGRWRPKLLGLLGLTTVVAILSPIGSNVEWRQIYGGLDGAMSFLALCVIFPVVHVTNRCTERKLWRGLATLAVAAAVSMVINFTRERLEAFLFCASIGVASHIGLWLASSRSSLVSRKSPAIAHAASAAVLAELS